MTQSTMTNPSTSTAYDPYETIDTSSLESLSFDDDASSKSSEPAVQARHRRERGGEDLLPGRAEGGRHHRHEGQRPVHASRKAWAATTSKKGVDADVVDENNAKVDLSIILEYGKSATDVFDQLKDVIAKDIKDMTGLNVIEMTVNVVDVMDQEEFNQKRGNNDDDNAQDGSNN